MRAFAEALRAAGVHTCNFIRPRVQFPTGCKLISKEKAVKLLKHEQISFAIMAPSLTNESGQIITAGIGMVQTKTKHSTGF
jgi:pyruvoyl-dependent arginine decarboxylase (PvlArgDC)